MNVLSKLFVDTRENILSVCLAVLHILHIDRVVRLGSSAAKKLLPRRLWSREGNTKAIQVTTDDDGFDEAQLPLSRVKIDRDGVETYEAVSVRPLSRAFVDSNGVETFEAVVSTSSARDEVGEATTPVVDDATVRKQSSSLPPVDLNGRSACVSPEEACSEDGKTVSAESALEKLADSNADTQDWPKHLLPLSLPSEDERSGSVESTPEPTDSPVLTGQADKPLPHEQPKNTSELLPRIGSRGGAKPLTHEFKIPGIYIGDLVEAKSPWATSSRNLLATPTEEDRERVVTTTPTEESSSLVVAMQTPLPDKTLDSVDESSTVNGAASDDAVQMEERPSHMLAKSSGPAAAVGGDMAADEQPEPSSAEEDRVASSSETPHALLIVKHQLEEPQLQTVSPQSKEDLLSRPEPTQESDEVEVPSHLSMDSSLKRKEASPLLEESSGLAVAMESPLKKRKDEEAPEQAPPHKQTGDLPLLHHTHEMADLLAESHAKQKFMNEKAAEKPTKSFSDPLNMNSSPEAYAMSLISPSSSVLRKLSMAPAKTDDLSSPLHHYDKWKSEEEAVREKRVSVQTNDTEDADSESNDQDSGEQRAAAAFEVMQLTGRMAAPAARAESEISDTDGQSVASTSEDEPWNSEDEEIFNAKSPFMNHTVSAAIYHTV